jgi:putative redox protein
MVEIQIVYEGQLRCKATHVQSGSTLLTDAPKDNMGKGESFSPTDLVATALGACMMTIMGIYAQRLELNLNGSRVRVLKEMTTTPPRRIARLTVDLHLPARIALEDRAKFEQAALACPVHKSISHEVEIPIQFHWDQ